MVASVSTDGFNIGANSAVHTLAIQPDGRILVGGEFTMLGGGICPKIGRLDANGTLDTSFNAAGADNAVKAIAVQPDGKIVLGGYFTSLGGTALSYIGRLNAGGSLDTSFTLGADAGVYVLAVQPDGKILVGGDFTTLGGSPRLKIGRLNADGSLDTAFNPGADGRVIALAIQPDGKIVVGGDFATLGGSPCMKIGRLNADGSRDTSFNSGANAHIQALAVQQDGKIVVGGDFNQLGGSARSRIGRLNSDGTLDAGFNPGANSQVQALAIQPDGEILVGGAFDMLGGISRLKIGRLHVDGTLDTSFNPGSDYNNSLPTLAVQPDGKIVVGGYFTSLGGSPCNFIGRLHVDGSLDTDFNPGTDNTVAALAVQPDGGILVGGQFTTLGSSVRSKIGRLNPNGSLDANFNPGANDWVWALAVQPNGKILVGGSFTTLGGGARNRIGRLKADGTLDTGFNPGGDGSVLTLTVQPDGKILVAGSFTTLGGSARNNIGRLNSDGSLDTSFDPGANDLVYTLAVQPDGKILVGGNFTTLGGDNRDRIGRLNADGSLDTGFNPGANAYVNSLAIQPDGKILVGGHFTTLGGSANRYLVRLNANGSLDTGFNPAMDNGAIALAIQLDGKILVGGNFTQLGGRTRIGIGRLNADGSLDMGFDPGTYQPLSQTNSLIVQPDGRILVGGRFTILGGSDRSNIGRLSSDTAALQNLASDNSGATLTWQRTVAGPEVSHVTFESSTDGTTYSSLGAGTRIANGWKLTGLSLPKLQNLFIRARAYYANGSGSVAEWVQNIYLSDIDSTAPSVSSILRADANPTNATSVDFTITFSEPVTGVNTADFALTTTGLSGASIAGVSGSGSTYTVTVNTGSGNGTIRLDLTDNDSIVDAASNPLGGIGIGNGNFTTGESYMVDKTSPIFTNGQAASLVLCLDSFISYSPSPITMPFGVAVDPTTGKIFVSDSVTPRVLRFASVENLVNGAAPEGVLGQPDFTTGDNLGGTTRSKMQKVGGIYVDFDGRLWVADFGNNRVLRFDNAASKANGADADAVLGQSDFSSGGEATTQNGMFNPYSVFVDSARRLWVAEQGNFRVTRYDNAASKANGANADIVLGQADFTSRVQSTTRNGMSYIISVYVDMDGRLWVADYGNHRVLRFDNAASKANGANADGVLGQSDFTSNTFGTTQSKMREPFAIGHDADGRLYVADYVNSRVLIFNNASGLANGANASSVLGQPDFTTGTVNTGGLSAKSLHHPTGVFYDNATKVLWVADMFNWRALMYGTPTDRIVPRVISIVRASANPTTAPSVDFTVTFSESVTGVNAADFTLTTTGVSGAAISGVSGSGNTYTVSVNTGSGSGTIRLDVVDNDTIVDAASNPLGGTGVGNGNFTTGEVYTVNKGVSTPPSRPTLASPANNAKVSGPSPLFNWNNSTVTAGVVFDHYQIQIATDNGFTAIVHDNNVSGITNSQDNTAVLASGTTYYWRVRAFNTLGQSSAWSAVRPVRINFAGPTLNLPASGSTVSSLTPTFTWDAVSGAATYRIQVSTSLSFSPGPQLVINQQGITATSYTPSTSLIPGTTYYWHVRVNTPTSIYAPGDWSVTFTFTTP